MGSPFDQAQDERIFLRNIRNWHIVLDIANRLGYLEGDGCGPVRASLPSPAGPALPPWGARVHTRMGLNIPAMNLACASQPDIRPVGTLPITRGDPVRQRMRAQPASPMDASRPFRFRAEQAR